jgi:transcriptional regulator with XRE-family HTH domain
MKRITAEREARGWSKAELARRAGMNDASVSQIERGILRRLYRLRMTVLF